MQTMKQVQEGFAAAVKKETGIVAELTMITESRCSVFTEVVAKKGELLAFLSLVPNLKFQDSAEYDDEDGVCFCAFFEVAA